MKIRIFRPAKGPDWLEQVLASIERLLRAISGFGFYSGDGGAVTQATSKATAVTLDTLTGEITTHGAILNAATIVSFTLNDTRIAAGDQILVSHHSGGTIGAYTVTGRATGTGTGEITIRNNTAANLTETLVLKFSIIAAFTA